MTVGTAVAGGKRHVSTLGCLPGQTPTREALLARSAELFGLIGDGRLSIEIGGRYQLADAARAHQDLESRATTGKLLLLP